MVGASNADVKEKMNEKGVQNGMKKEKERQKIKTIFSEMDKKLAFQKGRTYARLKEFVDIASLKAAIKISRASFSQMFTEQRIRMEQEITEDVNRVFKDEIHIIDGFVYEQGKMNRERIREIQDRHTKQKESGKLTE